MGTTPLLEPVVSPTDKKTDNAPIDPAMEEARSRAIASLSIVPDHWKAIGQDLFRPNDPPAAKPTVDAFRVKSFDLILKFHDVLEPMLIALGGSKEREPYQKALAEAQAHFNTDTGPLAAIKEDVDDVIAGGDIAYNTPRIVGKHAMLTKTGKEWITTANEYLISAFYNYVENGECMRQGRIEHRSLWEQYEIEGAQKRVASAKALYHLLRRGYLGEQPQESKAATDSRAPSEEQAKQWAADAKTLADEIITTVKNAKPKKGKAKEGKIVDDEAHAALIDKINKAHPQVKDLLYANAEAMNELNKLGNPAQAMAVLQAADSVEALYRECIGDDQWIADHNSANEKDHTYQVKVGKGGKPFELLRDYLLDRPGEALKAQRNRVLEHTRLKDHIIDPLPEEESRLIFRIIIRGTADPSAEDQVHDAARSGDSVAAARALLRLSSEEPRRLLALQDDHIFRHAIEKMTDVVNIDGVEVRPYHLCLTMWGLQPVNTLDPGLDGQRQLEINPDAVNQRPLKVEERYELDTELFGPYIERFRSEIAENIVDDDDMQSIARGFEKKAATEPFLGYLRREGIAAGPELEKRYNFRYDRSLRGDIQEYTEGDERRECERVLGIRSNAATVGIIDGKATLMTDREKDKLQLEQALRETKRHDTDEPLSTYTIRMARSIKDNVFPEMGYNPMGQLGMGIVGVIGLDRDTEPLLGRWKQYKDIIEVAAPEIEKLTGKKVHAIELLSNAFTEYGGDLSVRIAQGYNEEQALFICHQMGLTPKQIAERRMMGMAGDAGKLAELRADEAYAAPAQHLFDQIAGLRAEFNQYQLLALGSLRNAFVAMAPIPQEGVPPAPSAAPPGHASIEERPPRTAKGYYQMQFGIDPDVQLERMVRALGDKGGIAATDRAAWLGLDPTRVSGEIKAPTEDLIIDDKNRFLVKSGFDVATAENVAAEIWRVLHDGGQMHLIQALLYGNHNDEEQRLIRIAFRRLSGGLDLTFYIRQAQFAKKDFAEHGYAALEGVSIGAQGTKDAKDHGDEIKVSGDDTQLETALTVAVTGEVDNLQRLRAAAGNGDIDQIFRVVDDCTDAECRKAIEDKQLMTLLHNRCDQYAWDRVYKTLTGQSDLADRLYSRAHGAYDTWNPFDCTDEAGMRADIKAYVKRLSRKYDEEVRASYKDKDEKPTQTAIDAEVKQKVRDACQRLMANKDVRNIIEEELSGYELTEVESLILNAGEENGLSAVIRGDRTASQIIDSIKKMTPEQRAHALEDPEYMRQMANICKKQGDFRDAMNALRGEGGDSDDLAKLDKASRTARDLSGGGSSEPKKILESLAALSPEEHQKLLENPRLQMQIFAGLSGDDLALAKRMVMIGDDAKADVEQATKGLEKTGTELDDKEEARLALLRQRAVAHMSFAAKHGWDTALAQAVEVYKLDFRPHPTPAPGDPAGSVDPMGDKAKAAKQSNALDKASDKLRQEVWEEVASDVRKMAEDPDSQGGQHPIPSDDCIQIIKQAVLGKEDPSTHRIKENIQEWSMGPGGVNMLAGVNGIIGPPVPMSGVNVDHEGLKKTLNAASDEHLINEWTTVKKPTVNGSVPLETVYQEYRTLKEKGPTLDEGAPPGPTAYDLELDTKRLKFLNYVIDISRPFEHMLLPYIGDDNDLTKDGAERGLQVRENKKYHTLVDIVRDRIPTLPAAKIGKAIGADPDDQAMIDNPNRQVETQRVFREDKYLRSRGENGADRDIAQNEKEALDQAMARYERRIAIAHTEGNETDKERGLIDEAEKKDIDSRGEEFERALQAYKDARAAWAMWVSLIVGVLLTVVITALTGGLATGPVAMLLMGAVTGAVQGLATASIHEYALDTEYEFKDEGLKTIGREVLTGVITAGTTYFGQKLIAGLSGASTLAKQANAAGQVMRKPPPLWKALAAEAGEEMAGEAMTGTIEAGIAAMDPVHWMHGYTEGSERAWAEASARLNSIPGDSLRAGVTSIVTGFASRKLLKGANGDALEHVAEEGAKVGKVNVKANLKKLLGGQSEKMIEVFAEYLVGLGYSEGSIDLESVPAELFKGWLDEMKSQGIDEHVGTAHAGDRKHRSSVDIERHRKQFEGDEEADFQAMQDSASGSDPYVSVNEYVMVRSQVAADSLAAWAHRTKQTVTPAQAKAYIKYCRAAKDAAEFQTRLQQDPLTIPEVVAAIEAPPAPAVEPPNDDQSKKDQEDDQKDEAAADEALANKDKPPANDPPPANDNVDPTVDTSGGDTSVDTTADTTVSTETQAHTPAMTASSVMGTDFHGRALAADVGRTQAAIEAGVTNPGMMPKGATLESTADGVRVTFPVGDGTHTVTVNVKSAPPSADGISSSVATHSIHGQATATIVVSQGANPHHIEQAVAAQLAEISFILGERAMGVRTDTTSALHEGSQAKALSASDVGRVAQLRVLALQLDVATKNGATEQAKALTHEVQALLLSMGLLEDTDPTAKKMEYDENPEWNRTTGADAVTARIAMIKDHLAAQGLDVAQIQAMIDAAKADPAGIADARAKATEAKAALRAAIDQAAKERDRLDAALTARVKTGIGPDGKTPDGNFVVFDRLIIGGGWSAVSHFVNLGVAGDSGAGIPGVMAIGMGAEPWSTRGEMLMGQNATELEVAGFKIQTSDVADNQHEFVPSSGFAAAVDANRADSGMPTFNGAVAKVEERPDDADPTAWPEGTVKVILDDGRVFFARAVSVVSGPGPARSPTAGAQQGGRKLVSQSGGLTTELVVDPESGIRVDPNGQFQAADGSPIHIANVPLDVQQRLGWKDGVFTDPRVKTDPETGFSVNTATRKVFDAAGSEVQLGDLEQGLQQRLAALLGKQRATFGGGMVTADFDEGAKVLIFGAGAGGAWDVEQAAAAKGAEVDWSARKSIPKLGSSDMSQALKPGEVRPDSREGRMVQEHQALTAQLAIAAQNNVQSEVERITAALKQLEEDLSFALGYNRRNTLPGLGAHSDEVQDKVNKQIRQITNMIPTPDGKIFVEFDDGTSGVYDNVVSSIGPDSTDEHGVNAMLKGVGLESMRGVNGEAEGAQNADGSIQVLGAASVFAKPEADPKFAGDLWLQGERTEGDSQYVTQGIRPIAGRLADVTQTIAESDAAKHGGTSSDGKADLVTPHIEDAETGNASAVGAEFSGTAGGKGVKAQVQQAITESLPTVAAMFEGVDVLVEVRGNQVVLVVGDVDITLDVRTSQRAGSAVASFELGEKSGLLRVSPEARPGDVERALAHEIAEIIALLRQRQGTELSRYESLGQNARGTGLSAHDHGRIAEVRVLLRQLSEANALGDAETAAQLSKDLQALLDHLGLVGEGAEDRIAAIQGQLPRAEINQLVVELDRGRRNVRAAELDGERGHSGVEVHSHFLGVVGVDTFRDKVNASLKVPGDSFVPMLQQIAKMTKIGHTTDADGTITNRGVSGDAIRIAQEAMAEVRAIEAKLENPALSDGERAELVAERERVAKEAVTQALTATDETDFNSSYEVRDELIKAHFAGPDVAPEDKVNLGYRAYAREAILALAADDISYTEQSNSVAKLGSKFPPDLLRQVTEELVAEGLIGKNQVEVRFLTMILTNSFGFRGSPTGDQTERPRMTDEQFGMGTFVDAEGKVQKGELQKVNDQIRERGDIMGMDIAGPEYFTFDDQGKERFKQAYRMLLQAAIDLGRPMVLRPHVGEGAIDPMTGKPWNRDKDRQRNEDGEVASFARAEQNVDTLLEALEELAAEGLFDPSQVIVRFGHATQTSPQAAAKMAELGVIAEVNLGSNVRTGAVDQTIDGVDGATSPTEQFDDHSLLSLIYYGVSTILSTDAHSVMHTTMSQEYGRARGIIEDFLSGRTTLRVAGPADAEGKPTVRELSVSDLSAEEPQRFLDAYESLYTAANDYHGRAKEGDAVDPRPHVP